MQQITHITSISRKSHQRGKCQYDIYKLGTTNHWITAFCIANKYSWNTYKMLPAFVYIYICGFLYVSSHSLGLLLDLVGSCNLTSIQGVPWFLHIFCQSVRCKKQHWGVKQQLNENHSEWNNNETEKALHEESEKTLKRPRETF